MTLKDIGNRVRKLLEESTSRVYSNTIGLAKDPTVRQNVSNFSYKNILPVAERVQNFYERGIKPVTIAPQVKNTPFRVAASIPESVINIPSDILSSATKTGMDIRTGKIRDPRTLLGNVAQMGMPIVSIATLGGAGAVAKGLGKESLKTIVTQGAKTGLKYGTGFGVLGGLQSGENLSGADYAKNLIQNVVTGGAGGALVGGGLAGAGYGVGKGTKAFKKYLAEGPQPGFIAPGEFLPKGKTVKETRPPHQAKIENLINAGKDVEAKALIDKLPDTDPYKKSMQSLMGKVGKESKVAMREAQELSGTKLQLPKAQEPAQVVSSGNNIVSSVPTKLSQSRSLSSSVPQKADNINLNRLNLTKQQKATLTAVVDAVKPELQKVRGKVLSNKEVIESAKKSEILQTSTTREQTLQAEAMQLSARQKLVALDKEIDDLAKSGNTEALKGKMKDFIESLKVVSANATDKGRQLQALSIGADGETIKQTVIKDITKVEGDTNKVLAEALKVNWDDANSITKFYRQFVKPTVPEILDEFRYNNMLSNPRTHIRNTFSNLVQTFLTRPATIAVSGDIGGAGKYLSGASKSFPSAIEAFKQSFKGTTPLAKPDLEHIATAKLPKFLTIPTRAMEASDKFFSALIRGGEIARGTGAEEAGKIAEYSLFRRGLKPKEQGAVLNAIDDLTAWTYKAPKPVRWFVPFIRTPMNFAKQWIEYSPLGFSTMIGAGNKKEQLAKALIGSAVTAFGAGLALEDRVTWAAPTDPKQKELFYASGRKPYSIKIGDRWVSMQYAGPFAYALALPAAFKYYNEDSPKALTDSQLDKMGKSVTSMAKLLSGQTFLEGLNNFVQWASGDADYSLSKNLSFTAGQVIPLEGLIRWVSTIVDPIYRKPEGFVQGMESNIPFLSKNLKPYTTPTGEESRRERVNLLTPYDITKENPIFNQPYINRTRRLQENAVVNSLKKQHDSGVSGSDMTNMKTTDPEIAKELFRYSNDKTRVFGDLLFYRDGDTIRTVSLSDTAIQPELTGNILLDKERVSNYKSKISKRINDIVKLSDLSVITELEAESKIAELKSTYDSLGKTTSKAKPNKKVPAIKFKKVPAIKFKKVPSVSKVKSAKSVRTRSPVLKFKKLPSAKITQPKKSKVIFKPKKYTYKKPKAFRNTLSRSLTKLI
jgi:hypothetical protein